MITLTGNGRLTSDVQLRTTNSGKTVATISIASDRRDRDAQPVYVDLIVWQAQATAAAAHLVKGQAVSFSGRFEPREYVTGSGDNRIALELHGVELEYGPKPRGDQPSEPRSDITVHQSDARRAPGRLSRQGPPALRWALFEAAQCARRRGSPDHDYYLQTAARLGGNRACLAVARKLLKRSYHTLRELGQEAMAPA